MPAASRAATARNDVVVLPSVPGDPDHAQVPGRVARPPAGRLREGRPRAAHHDLRDRGTGDGPLDEGGRRPGRSRARHEVVTVDVEPGDGDEQRPGADRRASPPPRR